MLSSSFFFLKISRNFLYTESRILYIVNINSGNEHTLCYLVQCSYFYILLSNNVFMSIYNICIKIVIVIPQIFYILTTAPEIDTACLTCQHMCVKLGAKVTMSFYQGIVFGYVSWNFNYLKEHNFQCVLLTKYVFLANWPNLK